MNERAGNLLLALSQLIAEHEDELRNATSYVSKQNPIFFAAYYTEFSKLVGLIGQLKKIEEDARAIAVVSGLNKMNLKVLDEAFK